MVMTGPDGGFYTITSYDRRPRQASLAAPAGHARACAEAFHRILTSTPSLPQSRVPRRLKEAVRYRAEDDDAAYLRLKRAAETN